MAAMGDVQKNLPAGPGGLFSGLTGRVRLIFRLFGDRRVNPLLKILPLGSLIYLLVPDLAPGPIDDAFIIWLGSTLFVELCPLEIVEEHTRAIEGILDTTWHDPADGSVIDAETRDLD